jgi:acetoin utilization deacetylase AcuC-like enzyme
VKTVCSPEHRLHRGRFELLDGTLKPCVERPERVEVILKQLHEAKLGEIVPPKDFGLAPLLAIHDEAYLQFLKTAHADWREAYGEGDALPLLWPVRGFRQRIPKSIEGKMGYYAFDAATPITAGTWRAASTAAQVALTASELIGGGERSAFALLRPPGHHAARDLYGGYCFLNNAAIAAQRLAEAGARVAILDLDYHHGNGTQAIFYGRKDVLFVSLHADPAYDYPYFSGYADEVGAGEGEGYTLNLPLPLGTAWPAYEEALAVASKKIKGFAADVLVVSLGLDTYESDPIARFGLELEDYDRLGTRLAALKLPTLFVLEGGYALGALGELVTRSLIAFLDGK